MNFIDFINLIQKVLPYIKPAYNFVSSRYQPSISYFDLYHQIKNVDFNYKFGKKFLIKNVFFTQFATMHAPLSFDSFNQLVYGDNALDLSILNLDGVIDGGRLYHNGYQLPVYSYPFQFIEPYSQLGYLYENPNDISIKINQIDSKVLSEIEAKPVIVVKYPQKFIQHQNKIIECVIEIKPIRGINPYEFKNPYSKYILSKLSNHSDYDGFYVEIIEVKSSKKVVEDVNIKFHVLAKPTLDLDFYEDEQRAKIYYALGTIPSQSTLRQHFPVDFGVMGLSFNKNLISNFDTKNYTPIMSPLYTKLSQEWFINYYNKENIFQFGKNTTIYRHNEDKKKLLNQINCLSRNLKKCSELKKLNFKQIITTDGNSAFWDSKLTNQ